MMREKVVMVTGANGGMGKVIARELARQEASVVMVSRNRGKGEEARREIAQTTGSSSVELLIADLSSQESVRDLAHQFRERHPRLDVLVNNAGAHVMARKLSVDGIEMNLAVNHLSAFLLTNLLLDPLKAGAPARIVNVASQAMADARPLTLVGRPRPATIDFDDLQGERGEFVPFEAYGRAKLAMLLTTYALARRLAGTGVTANALHPGITATNIVDDVAPPPMRPFLGMLKPFLPTPERGARTALYLATSPEVEGVSGRYFIREKEAPSVPISYNEALQERMWEVSARLTGLASVASGRRMG
jgi:NAD(P)-dependent dehydrogenase (short-subunit alcohol dehydrogenase family)